MIRSMEINSQKVYLPSIKYLKDENTLKILKEKVKKKKKGIKKKFAIGKVE